MSKNIERLNFEWDVLKDRANVYKHNVSFATASRVFYDPKALTFYDQAHSNDEERFIIIGEDSNNRTLMVCHCYRGINDEVIRIISAREANSIEQELYRSNKYDTGTH